MKTPINTSIAAIVALAMLSLTTKGADLIVSSDPSSNYNSIVGAVDSAQDGDRIIVKNRTSGNTPWTFQGTNQLTIDKSLTFLSFANDTFFRVEGDVEIVHDNGREVTINGMRIVNTGGSQAGGSISANASGSGGFAQVNIVNCYLENGSIDFGFSYFRLRAVGNDVNGTIDFQYGQIIGNDIANFNSTINGINLTQSSSTSTQDTALIMGNKIFTASDGIILNSQDVYYHVINNFVDAGGSNENGIRVSAARDDNNAENLIYNNTIDDCEYAIEVTNVSGNPVFEVYNNVVGDQYSGTDGVAANSFSNASVFAYYNYIDKDFSNEIDSDVTTKSDNVTGQQIGVNFDGTLVSNSPAEDGALPSSEFADLDLTRGDAGAYGGSYTLDNFFPLFNGSARVYNVRSPFKVKQGNSFSIEGDSYDR